MSADPWAQLAGRFVDHYDSLYGQVRTRVLHEHLRTHAAPPPARVVDIGGGAGHQAIPLAREGYEVTIVDPSAAMLDEARGLLRAEPRDVASRVQLVEGSGEAASGLLGADAAFDIVLCHAVVMYLDDPAPLMAVLARLAAPGGIVSVVAKNARALAIRPALERDWHATLEAFDADHQVNALGIETRADTVESLTAALAQHDVETLAWYGVRLFTEGWARSEPPRDPEDMVFAAELEASRRDPYRELSRLFHWVGRK